MRAEPADARTPGTKLMVSDVRSAGDYFAAVRVNPGPVSGSPFRTWGTGVRNKTLPSTAAARGYAFPGPTTIRARCREHAETVTSEGCTDDARSYLPDHRARTANICIQGAAWLEGTPT